MIIQLHKRYQELRRDATEWDSEGNAIAWNEEPVMLWKFEDENGNLWNTETPIEGTEADALAIIMQSANG